MNSFLENISIICIYLKNYYGERFHEISLYQPLEKKSEFNEEDKTVKERHKKLAEELPLWRRMLLNVQVFLMKRFPVLVNPESKSAEAKFKTVLAILLIQESLKHFFLDEAKQRENFLLNLEKAAKLSGYDNFVRPSADMTINQMARILTTISFQKESLLDDIHKFYLHVAILQRTERDEILFAILNNIERMPLTSVVEVTTSDENAWKIAITTKYGKYKIKEIDTQGNIDYIVKENETKVSIPSNQQQFLGGTVNQHKFFDTTESPKFMGAVCGQLKTPYHVLEQIFFLLEIKDAVAISEHSDFTEEKKILFTSLFSWNEFEKIQNEHRAIFALHGKTLIIQDRRIRLTLFHQNISFNAFNKFPKPSEINASINDLNDYGFMPLCHLALNELGIEHQKLTLLLKDQKHQTDFLKQQHCVLESVDAYRSFKKQIIDLVDNFLKITNDPNKHVLATCLKTLLLKKLPNGKVWHEIDHLIYLSLLATQLGIDHNKNCEHATDRSAGAISIDKAQNAYQKIVGKLYLPGLSTKLETSLFKVLYSIYLVFEEPELNAGLCTGFIGEKFYNNFIQKNPETTHYLTSWLHKHPETYLGLSQHRF